MKFFLIAACLLLKQFCFAQTVRSYDIGDTLPPIRINNLMDQHGSIDLQLLKGKLIILDFWAINCGSCIASMPKMDSLQQLFSDKLQIILVTRDSTAAIKKLFRRVKIKQPNLPMVVEDKLLSSYFPYEFVPHHVWINELGVVKFITSGNNTNQTTLTAYFNRQLLTFNKQASLTNFDLSQPTWLEGGGRLSHHLRYYSALSGYLTEQPFSYNQIIDDKEGVKGLKLLNVPLLVLFKKAYGGIRETGDFARDNRISIEVNDKNAFYESDPLKKDTWVRTHHYCYEVVTPPLSEQAFCEFMQRDIEKYFPYQAAIEKRRRTVICLERISDNNITTGTFEKYSARYDSTTKKMNYCNVPASTLASHLRFCAEKEGKIFIDNTGSALISEVSLSYPFTNWQKAASELQRFGYTMREKSMEIDMLVIKDKPAIQDGQKLSRIADLPNSGH